MSKTPANALAKIDPNLPVIGTFAIATARADIADVIRENMGGRAVNAGDLDRVKIPSSGGIAWEIPTLGEPEIAKDITGIVIYKRRGRVYFDTPYNGEQNAPVCSSQDGEHGQGEPGGECAKCPFAQFGSAVNEKGEKQRGQACAERELLFVLRESDILPIVISAPPTSLHPLNQYFLRLASKGIKYWEVVSKLSLTKASNRDGVPYSQVSVGLVAQLNAAEVERITATVKSYQSVFNQVSIEDAA